MPTISPQVTPYYGGGQVVNPADVIQVSGAPSTAAIQHNLGTLAVDNGNENIYGLVSKAGGVAIWAVLGGTSAGTFSGLTGDNSATATPNPAVIVAGTANQITTSAASHTLTLSLPSSLTAPGSVSSTTTLHAGSSMSATTSITAGTTLTATLGAITATNGNLVLGTAGNKIVSSNVGSTTSAGANSFGSVALVGGTATVATSSVTANSLIFLQCQALGTVSVAKAMAVTSKTASTSFVITSADATDTSTVAWFIVN